MHLFYIDDSKDEQIAVFSALSVPADQWRDTYNRIKSFRAALKKSDGIPIRTELHATEFVAGRGSLGIPTIVIPKGRRCSIYLECLRMITSLPGISIINVCMSRSREDLAFEYLVNRIQKAAEHSSGQALIISDRGKEGPYTKLIRRMGVFNHIPSQYGSWDGGKRTKNIPTDRVIEDAIFKDSKSSHLVQMADLCAYALLRRERPLESKNRYGIQKAFDILSPVLNRNASTKDPDGIVRY